MHSFAALADPMDSTKRTPGPFYESQGLVWSLTPMSLKSHGMTFKLRSKLL
jgi:hypothetical protein